MYNKKLLLAAFLIVIGFVGLVWKPNFNKVDYVSPIVTEEQTQVAPPTRLMIPAIKVNAEVEWVGKDNANRMDVPKDSKNVAWYSLGYLPSEKGSAVISGHLDNRDGSPAIFWDLNKLKPNDKIQVLDNNGRIHIFIVEKTVVYNTKEFPLNDIFASSGSATLNIITCEGAFINGSYDKRLVVYAVLDD